MATLRTTAEIDAELVELRAARRDYLLVPTSGSTGATSYSNAGKVKDLDAAIDALIREQRLVLNGGYGLRTRRDC